MFLLASFFLSVQENQAQEKGGEAAQNLCVKAGSCISEICKPEVRKKADAKQIAFESVRMGFKNFRTSFPVLAQPADIERHSLMHFTGQDHPQVRNAILK